jgi:hypothetical protein
MRPCTPDGWKRQARETDITLLDDAMALADDGAHSDHFKARLQSLVAWHDQASEILPMLAVLASRSSDD